MTLQELVELYTFYKSDPFDRMIGTCSSDQHKALVDAGLRILMEGGNQSGKSRTCVLKVVRFALEQEENSFVGQDVNIWYTTTTYDKFAEQAWGHFKNALLWPNESVAKLPTYRVESVNWLGKSPEKPGYFCVRRPSGAKAHIYVHTYAQGRGEFQGQTVHCAVVDEECSDEIFTEIWARTLACEGARLFIACTPIEGQPWLDRLRQAAETSPDTKQYRFRTIDNPSVNSSAVEELKRMYRDIPEELELRLLGIPRLGSSLVYTDRVFTPNHVISARDIEVSQSWTLNRAIDAGFRSPACVWIAVSPDEKNVVLYRAWKGKDMSIAEASKKIRELSGTERYYHDLIDPAVQQRSPETGQPEIVLWQHHGIYAVPAPDRRVRHGIERVWELMQQRVEYASAEGKSIERPRFRVIGEHCQQWLDERRKYRLKDTPAEPERDSVDFRPIKHHDHLMDATRYLVAAGLVYSQVPAGPPHKDSPAYKWWAMRHKKSKK